MILLRLQLHQFLSYREAHFEFAEAAIVLIAGDRGVGKSALLEAIVWGLWGTSPRAEDVDLCHWEADWMQVVLQLQQGDRQLQVQRHFDRHGGVTLQIEQRSRLETPWSDCTQSSLTATQAQINQWLGLDSAGFCQTSYYPAAQPLQWVWQSSRDRYQQLFHLLELRSGVHFASNDRDRLLAQRQQVQEQWEQARTQLQAQLEELQSQRLALLQQHRDRSEIEQALAQANEQIAQLEQWQQYREQVQQKQQERCNFLARLQARQRDYEAQLAELESQAGAIAPASACPLCNQTLDRQHWQYLQSRYQQQQTEIQNLIWVICEQFAVSEREIQILSQEYRDRSADLAPYAQTLTERGQLQAQLLAHEEQARQLQQLEQQIETVERYLSAGDFAPDLQRRLQRLDRQLNELGTSDPSRSIESELLHLQRRSQAWLDRLRPNSGQLHWCLGTTAEGQPTLDLQLQMADRDRSLKTCSSSEAQMLELAIRLAWLEILAARSPHQSFLLLLDLPLALPSSVLSILVQALPPVVQAVIVSPEANQPAIAADHWLIEWQNQQSVGRRL